MSVNGNGTPPQRPAPPPPNQNAENAQLAMIEQVTARLQADLEARVTNNKAGLALLARRGIQPDAAYMLDMHIQSLRASMAATMGASGPMWELHSRLAFELEVEKFIARAMEEGTKAQLAMGGSMSATQIRQMARQTGTYGG